MGSGRKDFMRVCDRTRAELELLLKRSAHYKALFDARTVSDELASRRVAYIWDAEGFRNRVAFELGVAALGGVGVEVPGRLGERENVEDLSRYLDNWFDVIVARTASFELLTELADGAAAPVVNARTRHNHPCEIVGDLAYALNAGKDLSSLKVVFVGEATNLFHSWCEAAAILPIDLTQVCPPGFEVDPKWVGELVADFAGDVRTAHDLADVTTADIIYTDCWPSRSNRAERDDIRATFAPLQVNVDVLRACPEDTLFLPCPPVTRGEEVSDEAMRSEKCRVTEAKDWLLGAQNAILADIVGGGSSS